MAGKKGASGGIRKGAGGKKTHVWVNLGVKKCKDLALLSSGKRTIEETARHAIVYWLSLSTIANELTRLKAEEKKKREEEKK